MAKFCGKCGSPLDEATGLCPRCNAADLAFGWMHPAGSVPDVGGSPADGSVSPQQQGRPTPQQQGRPAQQQGRSIPQQQGRPAQQQGRPIPQQQGRPAQQQGRPIPQQQGRPAPQQGRPIPPQQGRPAGTPRKMTRKEKREAKKASRTFGKKVKIFFLKLLAVLLALLVVVSSASVALVYFDLAQIPFVETVMGWFGYEKKEPEASEFASVAGKFTDQQITNADEAVKAAKNAASQLGLQTAADELSLLNETTVGDLTYYRLRQNYRGIPVYGKTVVVVADKNGEAKSITTNAVEVSGVSTATRLPVESVPGIIGKELHLTSDGAASGAAGPTEDYVSLIIYTEDDGRSVLAYQVSTRTTEYIINAESGELIREYSAVDPEEAVCYNSDGTKKFVGYLEDGRYLSYDEHKNIFYYTLQRHNYKTEADHEDVELMYSEDAYFGNTAQEQGKEYDKGVQFIESVNRAYDYFEQNYRDTGFGTLLAYYNDGYDGGHNGLGGGSWTDAAHTLGRGIVSIGSEYDYAQETDLFGHEYTHVITKSHVGWGNKQETFADGDEPGAINEGYSDIFGEIIEAYGTSDHEPDWEHGSRIIYDPMSQGYPSTLAEGNKKYKEYDVQKDGGGSEKKYMMKTVGTSLTDYSHGFSTIVSRAAYLMHTGDGGAERLSLQQLSDLWYNTMLILPANCTFAVLRQSMEMTADTMRLSEEQKECVSAAFDEVGILSDKDSTPTYDVRSEIRVLDKNGLAYDDYTIVIDGKEFNGLFKLGVIKKDYHRDIAVDSKDPYQLNLPKGDYTVTIVDNFSGNKTYSVSFKAREDQQKNEMEFVTAFGFDYGVNEYPELQVKDVNGVLYDYYTVTIKGKDENGTAYNNFLTVSEAQPQQLDLMTGRYNFLIADLADTRKTKSFSVRVRTDASTSMLPIYTDFGKPYGEYGESDLPQGAREFNGHYYYIFNVPEITTWEAAQEFCRARNGYLATLTSREENSFAYGLLERFGLDAAYFGLYDSGYNEWKWVNNEKKEYENWAFGEPNSYSERYGMFYGQYVETWNDGDFGNYTSEDRAFICEWGAYEVDTGEVPITPTVRTTSGERDVVLCLDMSGSMAGEKLRQTKEASVKFINSVLEQDASVAVVTYDSSARVLSDFSTNAQDLIDKVNEISDGGSTNIEDGLAKSYNLFQYSSARKQIIVLMSDGEPNCGKVGEDLISYAESIRSEGIYLYTLGFFGGYSGQSAAQTLMERMATEGCHYEVSDVDSLQFFFGDIADVINGTPYYYIRVACPVDVKVTYKGETLNSSEEKLSTRTSFGSLSFEENTGEYSEEEGDNRVKVLRLKANDNYEISIRGTGRGRMNYTIGFMDENGDYSDFRKFNNIKITKKTMIDTVAGDSRTTVLNVDEDGDGKYDIRYKAGKNERGKVVDNSYLVYLSVSAAALLIVFILAIKIKSKKRKKKGGK